MKVETPQILWHNGSECDNGKNAPLYSLDLLSTGAAATTTNLRGNHHHAPPHHNFDGHDILATAGNSSEIHVWSIHMKQPLPDDPPILQATSKTDIRHLVTLNRHDRSVNIVKFSPDGRFLATAGDGGTIILWSCASRSEWSRIDKEHDLKCRVVHTPCAEGICDLDWSSSSNRFIVGSIDHSVLIYELSSSHATTTTTPTTTTNTTTATTFPPHNHHHSPQRKTTHDTKWNCIYRNSKDHTHFVQGVAYDPLGHYVTSMGSDRTVRVYPRKTPKPKKSSKKKGTSSVGGGTLVEQSNTKHNSESKNSSSSSSSSSTTADTSPPPPQLPPHADFEKLELTKCKTLKYFSTTSPNHKNTTNHTLDSSSSPPQNNNHNHNHNNNHNHNHNNNASKKQYLFADESTVESFFRRLRFTSDGAFLIAPTALWHNPTSTGGETSSSSSLSSSSSFATHIYARHQYDKPYKVLHGLEKPSVVIRPNPVLFQLPPTKEDTSLSTPPSPSPVQELPSTTTEGEKENQSPPSSKGLPYRHVFCVLTLDSILIYDTHHSKPLAIARGLHYAGLTDAAWSADGHHLVVSSTDGYISIVSFANGELGQVYVPPAPTTTTIATKTRPTTTLHGKDTSSNMATTTTPMATTTTTTTKMNISSSPSTTLPPCEPGPHILVARPSKRVKPTPVVSKTVGTPPAGIGGTTAKPPSTKKRDSSCSTDMTTTTTTTTTEELVGQAVTKLSLEQPTKKKKRIQPTLLTTVS